MRSGATQGTERGQRAWVSAANAVVGLILGAFFLQALFVPPEGTGAYDWLVIHHNWEAARISISRYGEWPAWNPFFCGGITISGNPEDQTLSPFFWLSFLTGTTLAIKVMLVVHAGLGAWGMRELCVREYGTSQSAAWLAAIVWTFSGFFAFHFGGGHATFAPFYLAPWIVLACRAAFCDERVQRGLKSRSITVRRPSRRAFSIARSLCFRTMSESSSSTDSEVFIPERARM